MKAISNELSFFIEATDVKRFSRELRTVLILYLESEIGKKTDNDQLIAGMERIFNLLDAIEDEN